MQFIMLFSFITAALLTAVEGLRARGQAATDFRAHKHGPVGRSYTFDSFVREFGRVYEAGSEEYGHRAAVFRESLSQIHAKNSRVNSSWTAGVHPFMDWTKAERVARLYGYRASGTRGVAWPAPLAALQTSVGRVYGNDSDSFESEGPPVRNQAGGTFGLCASCWAIAAVEAVEAQLKKPNSNWPRAMGEPQLSAQAMLDCVQNPKHCGGNGGCEGATPELAFDYMQGSGVALERDLPYHAANTGKCPIEPYPKDWMRVTISGWRALPTNQAQPLMQALVEDGPVVVSVDASGWHHYREGIFDDCPKDAVPNHSVLAKGYSHLEGIKYWVLQNSWSSEWGEEGAIRLFRHNDEDSWCGVDSRPQEGSACDDGAHQNVTVCGTCAVLFDSVVPQGARVIFANANVATADLEAEAASKDQSDDVVAAAEVSQEESSVAPQADSSSRAKAQGLLAQHSAVARTADASAGQPDESSPDGPSFADLADALPKGAGQLQAEAASTSDAFASLPADMDMVAAIPSERETNVANDHDPVSVTWPSSQAQQAETIHSMPWPAGTAGHLASLADSFLPGWRSKEKTPHAGDEGDVLPNFRTVKAAGAIESYLS